MQIETITIPARDGLALTGTCYRPDVNPANTVVIINSATAVPQRFYNTFSTFLVEQGYMTLTSCFAHFFDRKNCIFF